MQRADAHVTTTLEGYCGQVPASAGHRFSTPIVLNLHAAAEVKVPNKRTRSQNYPRQRFGRNTLVEVGCIERCPELAIEARGVEISRNSGDAHQLLWL